MFLIHTDNSAQRQCLQQQFSTQNGVISIPARQSDSLADIIKSITYQYFHEKPPNLALDIQLYITMTLKMHHSLQIYRTIMKTIKDYEQKLNLYQEYIYKMNQTINEQKNSLQQEQSQQSISNVDQVFDQSLLRGNHSSSILQLNDIPILTFETVKNKANDDQLQSQKTKNSSSPSSNQCIRQTLDSMNKLNNFFNSASAIYNREDWKTQRSVNKQDSQLDSFEKKGESIIQTNSSLKILLVNQMTYDIKRAIQEIIPKIKEQKLIEIYNRKIRNTLFFSKIGLRKKESKQINDI